MNHQQQTDTEDGATPAQAPTQIERLANLQLRHHEETRRAVADIAADVKMLCADVADIKAGIVRERRASQADPAELERDAAAVMLGAQPATPSLWVRATKSRAIITIATAVATAITTLATTYAATHGAP